MGEGENAGGSSKSLWDSVQGLIALAVGYGLMNAISWLWPSLFHGALPPEWLTRVVPQLAGAVIALGVFATTKSWLRWQTRKSRWTAVGRRDRLTILVAKLGEDADSKTARTAIIRSILNEVPAEVVEVIPAGVRYELTEGVSEDVATAEPAKQARALMKKKNGDLLIWGRVHHFAGKDQIELRFVSDAEYLGLGDSKIYGVGDKLTLDADFAPEIGAIVARVICTLGMAAYMKAVNYLTVTETGPYLVEGLGPVVGLLEAIRRRLPTSMKSSDRGQILFVFGLLQGVIGKQSSEKGYFLSAVSAYREVLEEWTQERVPLDWAIAQYNLGNALLWLGERESGTGWLDEAVVAYQEALKERRRELVPLDWASTQTNLGIALSMLGERGGGTKRLEDAISAYRAALMERTQERFPLDWALTQNNLGNALLTLGRSGKATTRLVEAVTAYREALKERTRELVPLQWASTQNNLGNTLLSLGELESGTQLLNAAVVAYRSALTERQRERVPLEWALTQKNLGIALATLGERESDAERLEEAITCLESVLDILHESATNYEAGTQKAIKAVRELSAKLRAA